MLAARTSDNKLEKKYLLSLESGWVYVHQGRCPVPGCGKETTCLDRYVQSHTELLQTARSDAITACKHRAQWQNVLNKDIYSILVRRKDKPCKSGVSEQNVQDTQVSSVFLVF